MLSAQRIFDALVDAQDPGRMASEKENMMTKLGIDTYRKTLSALRERIAEDASQLQDEVGVVEVDGSLGDTGLGGQVIQARAGEATVLKQARAAATLPFRSPKPVIFGRNSAPN